MSLFQYETDGQKNIMISCLNTINIVMLFTQIHTISQYIDAMKKKKVNMNKNKH